MTRLALSLGALPRGADPARAVCISPHSTPQFIVTPFIQKFADGTPNVDFYKIDIDEFPEVAEDLEVGSVPTFVMYKDNKVVARIVGASSAKVEEMVKSNM